jgi:hypothetical protein
MMHPFVGASRSKPPNIDLMPTSSDRPIVIETLKLQLIDPSLLALSGTVCTPTAQDELRRRLAELHTRIQKLRLTAFTIDVRRLDFVNSSVIRLFVDWISRAESAHYKLVFWVDKSITWHRISFSALKSLAPLTVEVVDKAPSSATLKARAKLRTSSQK